MESAVMARGYSVQGVYCVDNPVIAEAYKAEVASEGDRMEEVRNPCCGCAKSHF